MDLGVGTVICLVGLVGLQTFAGISFNIFILIHIFLDFLQYCSVSPRNKILAALCVSGLCYTIMTSTNLLLGILLSPTTSPVYILCIMFVFTMYSISSCSWLTACLCFFYFIKILHIKSHLLVQLKLNIKTVVPWLILGVEMISLCGSLVNVLIFIPPQEHNHNVSNVNDSAGMTEEISKYLNIIYMVNVVPFLIVMVTAVSTAASLILHLRKMGRRLETSGHTGLAAHHRAVKTMLALLCLYSTFYIVLFIRFFSNYSILSLENWIYLIVMFSFSPVQAVVLIHGNPKLWKSLLRMSTWLSCI
ncbi:taste receptor type 2 member 113-like [Rhinoderma darwinii]|uniref:taste receptor type 2 member 113-like n=1 Tax=Rhinoderma darwinii TaxID=43563 RepID=UPI003F66FFF2